MKVEVEVNLISIVNEMKMFFFSIYTLDPRAFTSYIYIYTSPSVSVALRPIGATHLKLTADMRPYSSLFLPCRMLYTLLSTISHSVNFVPIVPVES